MSDYRKNEFIKWFFIPIIIFVVITLGLLFILGFGEANGYKITAGISGLISLIVSIIMLFFNLKVKERIQGLLLSIAILIFLEYFTCFSIGL